MISSSVVCGQITPPAYDRISALAANTALLYAPKPWHLALQVTIAGGKGVAPQSGTIERWQSGDDSRTVFTFGGSSSTRLQENGKTYKLSQGDPLPQVAGPVLEAVLHPGPFPAELAGTTPELRRQSFGKTEVDCIMLDRPMPRVAFAPLGLFPTYCLSDGEQFAASYNFGSYTVLRTATGKFLDRRVLVGLTLMEGSTVLARAKISSLTIFTPKPDEFDPTPELAATGLSVRVSGGVMQAMVLKRTNPIYPVSARTNRISGQVVLNAKIGADGRVHELTPISAPDPDLVIAALAAVREWIYKPYLLNGEPVDVNTTITVNFNLR